MVSPGELDQVQGLLFSVRVFVTLKGSTKIFSRTTLRLVDESFLIQKDSVCLRVHRLFAFFEQPRRGRLGDSGLESRFFWPCWITADFSRWSLRLALRSLIFLHFRGG